MTMFGVTTACVTMLREALERATSATSSTPPARAGRAWRSWPIPGSSQPCSDLTTTEVPDFLVGGVFPCTEDRFGSAIRTRIPYVGSVGAVDMVNWGAKDTVPARFADRNSTSTTPRSR
jgi:uncharacterized protein (UPF0261 family)